MLALGGLVVDLVGGGGQVAEKLDVLAQVFVMPFPLIASDLDIHIRFTAVIDMDQGAGRGYSHGDQDHQGDDCPQDFDSGALMKPGRLLAGGATVDDHRPEHGPEDDDADHHTDPEDGHVQVEDRMTDFGCTWRHIHGPGRLCLAEH